MGISYGGSGSGASPPVGGGGGGTSGDTWFVSQTLINRLASAMSANGVTPDVQVKIFAQSIGVQIGDGGKGSAGSSGTECMYCHQTGNGGHGGFCPNGSW